jgi:hypothetical protein
LICEKAGRKRPAFCFGRQSLIAHWSSAENKKGRSVQKSEVRAAVGIRMQGSFDSQKREFQDDKM